jgi:hypothetical protein
MQDDAKPHTVYVELDFSAHWFQPSYNLTLVTQESDCEHFWPTCNPNLILIHVTFFVGFQKVLPKETMYSLGLKSNDHSAVHIHF